MIGVFLMRIVWVLVLVALQVLFFNNIHLWGYATPLVYVYVLCFLPQNTSRYTWLIYGFLVGLVVDMFSEIPGLSAASMTATSMCAPVLLNLFTPKDAVEDLVPGFSTLGRWSFINYVILLVLLHNAVFIMLEMFSYFNVLDMLYSYLASSLLSIMIILAMEALRSSK